VGLKGSELLENKSSGRWQGSYILRDGWLLQSRLSPRSCCDTSL